MERLFRVIVLLTIIALPIAAYAQSDGWDYWRWRFDAGVGDPSSVFSHPSEFGVSHAASDEYDGDGLIRTEGITSAIYAATYHNHSSNNDGWSGSTGFYDVDVRAPVPLQAGQSKSWLIYVWATPDVSGTFDTIYASCYMIMPPSMPSEYSFTLKLAAKPDGMINSPALGTTWGLQLPSGVDLQLPIYRTDNGLTGYLFELKATALPEPSSLLALICGIAGLGALKRQKRALTGKHRSL